MESLPRAIDKNLLAAGHPPGMFETSSGGAGSIIKSYGVNTFRGINRGPWPLFIPRCVDAFLYRGFARSLARRRSREVGSNGHWKHHTII